jgi:hypothetical protein
MPFYVDLEFQSIRCLDDNETTEDEIRIQVGSNTIWSGDMNQGETENLGGLDPVSILWGDYRDVHVWEGDDWEPWPLPDIDPDDFLGTERVTTDWVNPGDDPHRVTLDFNAGSDGHYQIEALLIA